MQIVKKYFVKAGKRRVDSTGSPIRSTSDVLSAKAESIMKSKGYQRFSTRLIYFRQDIEVVDVFFKNKEKLKHSNSIFLSVDPVKHPLLNARDSTRGSRNIIMSHLRKSVDVAFLKEMYEEVTEYIRYIIYQGSQNGVEAGRIVGEHNFKMPANDVLSLATKEDVIKVVIDQVFQQLEAERSTIDLLTKTKNKLGLTIEQRLIDDAIPYLTCRHIFVHSDGKPNNEFILRYPHIALDTKQRISLNMDFLNSAFNAVDNLLRAYDAEMIRLNYISRTEIIP